MTTAATPTSSTSLTPANIMANSALNAQARSILLFGDGASNPGALRQTLALNPNTGYVGGNKISQKLENLGILTSLGMLVSMTVTNNAASGGAALVPSIGFPYNLIDTFTLRDYANLTRLQMTGLQLWLRNSIHRGKTAYGAVSLAEGAAGTNFAYPTSDTQGAIAAASSATVQFFMRIPVSVGDMNTVGAMLMQAITGQVFAEATIAADSTTGGFDSPFTGNYSITDVSVQFVQSYLQPQGPNPILPYQDLSTVYELNGKQPDTTNLAVNLPKYINFPDARIVHGMYLIFANGGYNYGSDLASLKIRVSGNTYIRTDPPTEWIMNLREDLGADLMPGFYFFSSSRVPVITNLLGQVQFELTPSLVNAGAYTNIMSESTYMVNTPLPGLGG